VIFLYFLIFAMPFYRHPVIDSGSGAFTLVKSMGLAGLFYTLFYIPAHGLPNYLQSRQAKLFFAIFSIAAFSFLRKGKGPNVEVGDPFMLWCGIVVFFLLIVSLVDTPTRIRRSLLVAVGSICFASLYPLREFSIYSLSLPNFRPEGKIVGDSNYFALAAMLGLPIAYSWFISERRPVYRWSLFACLVVISAGTASVGSRGGLLALMAFVGFIIYHSQHRIRNSIVLSMVLVTPMLFIPRNPITRFLHPDYADVKASGVRIETWKAGLRMIKKHPIAGIGLGEFKPQISKYTDDPKLNKLAHNTYLEIASELGLVCFSLYLWLLYETYQAFTILRKMAQKFQSKLFYNMALGMQGGLVGFFVSSFFLSAEYVKFFWFYVFMSIAMTRVARKWAIAQERSTTTIELNPAPALVEA
jgi:O-antigen ligase